MGEEAPKRRLAESIQIVQDGAGAPSVYIDGVLFPYYTANEPKTVSIGRGRMAGVTLTLLAKRVAVDVDLDRRPALEPPA